MSAVALRSFGFGEQLVRTVDQDDEPWFVAKDVCAAIELPNHHQAVRKLDKDEVMGVTICDPQGRPQPTTVISESGMYTLVLRTHGATREGTLAHRFKRWVTREVLPQIRRTGRYEPGGEEAESAPAVEAATGIELSALSLKLAMVREARHAFGPKGARRAWELAGLPDVTSEAAPVVLLEVGQGPMLELNREVIDWIKDRCEIIPKWGEMSGNLYRDFEQWCLREARPWRSMAGFGRALSACGVTAKKGEGGRIMRIGLRLKGAGE